MLFIALHPDEYDPTRPLSTLMSGQDPDKDDENLLCVYGFRGPTPEKRFVERVSRRPWFLKLHVKFCYHFETVLRYHEVCFKPSRVKLIGHLY